MKKFLVVVIAIFLVGSDLAFAASPKANTPCSKLNQSSAVSTTMLICTKVKGKLIWTKKPSSQTPTAVASSTPTPSTTSTKPPAIQLNFSNLFENRREISNIAWEKYSGAIKSNQSKLPPVEVFTGPNTKTYVQDPTTFIKLITQLLPDAPIPAKVRIIYYSRADLNWGIAKAQELMGPTEFQNSFNAHGGPIVKCNIPDDCNDGDAFVASDKTAYLAIGLSAKPNEQLLNQMKNAGTELVEYYHALQEYYYVDRGSIKPAIQNMNPTNKPPFWMAIGGETIAMISYLVLNNQENNFKQFSKGTLSWALQTYPDLNLEKIHAYLDISNLSSNWRNIAFGEFSNKANMFGFPVMNILMAIKGPGVTLEFYDLMSQGMDFENAFKKEFGVSWIEAETEITKVLADQMINKY